MNPYIGKYSAGTWSALPHTGLCQQVYALAISGTDLYVGGAFTETRDKQVVNLNRIAKFSGGAWSALPNNGLACVSCVVAEVYALAVSGSDLYGGGFFTQTADGTVTGSKLYRQV